LSSFDRLDLLDFRFDCHVLRDERVRLLMVLGGDYYSRRRGFVQYTR